jgi:hypothetical protein
MKNPRIALCIASLGGCKTQFAISLSGLTARLAMAPISGDVDSQQFKIFYEESSILPQSQFNLVKNALEWNATHLFFLEDDMSFPSDAAHRLYYWDVPCVGANYLQRKGPPYTPCARLFDGSPLFTEKNSFGLQAAYVVPFGVTLFKKEFFEKIPEPWFAMPWVNQPGYFASSDGFLGMTARNLDIPIFIDHNLSKEVQHHGNRAFTWENLWELEK